METERKTEMRFVIHKMVAIHDGEMDVVQAVIRLHMTNEYVVQLIIQRKNICL